MSLLVAAGFATNAALFTPLPLPELTENLLNWSDGGAYAPLFPDSAQTLGGVPFQFQTEADGDNVFYGGTLGAPLDAELHIPVNLLGVTTVYTLINTAFGTAGSVVGSVTFLGSAGDTHSVDLVVGGNVRDHYFGAYENGLSDPGATAAVFGDPAPGNAHLDMQSFSLPAAFASQVLEEIVFASTAVTGPPNPNGKPFLAAATVLRPDTGRLSDGGVSLALLGLAVGLIAAARRLAHAG
jgi:hypothetical protein